MYQQINTENCHCESAKGWRSNPGEILRGIYPEECKKRFFATLRMIESEGLRMTESEGLRMTESEGLRMTVVIKGGDSIGIKNGFWVKEFFII
jgi:hypothetical protein